MMEPGRPETYPEGESYKNSAIARLLVTGSLGDSARNSTSRPPENEPPLDLSATARTKSNSSTRLIQCDCTLDSTSRKRKLDEDSTGSEAGIKCPYCPYTVRDPSDIYNHYQYHKQVLSFSASSTTMNVDGNPLVSKKSDEQDSPASATSPGGAPTSETSSTLRTLLQPKQTKQATEAQTASRYLKSIVQNIIRQRMPIGGSAHSSLAPSRASTPAHESLTPSSGMSSPRASASPRVADRRDQVSVEQMVLSSPRSITSTSPEATKEVQRSPPFGTPHQYNYAYQTDYLGARQAHSVTQVVQASSQSDSSSHNVSLEIKQELPEGTQRYYFPQQTSNDSDRRSSPSSASPFSTTASRPVSPHDYPTTHANGYTTSSTPPHSRPGGQPYPLYAHKQYKRVSTTSTSPRPQKEAPPRPATKEAMSQCSLTATLEDCQHIADSPTDDPAHSRCVHCGITFDDEVIFSIHMGCHNHRDPFICNVCGRHCGNKYGFYTHIMRGHEYS